MRSTFSGLNTMLLALQAQQEAVDTSNHNIANANTEGFSRQTASMTATTPYTLPAMDRPVGVPLQVGTGVTVYQIKRQRDAFIDTQVRQQMQAQQRWQTLADGLNTVQGLFNEPSDHGIQTLVSNFFNSWSELSNNPQSTAIRTTVRANGQALVSGLNDLSSRLLTNRKDDDGAITMMVPNLNDIGSQLASLNDQIERSVAAGDQPNDLQDKRDLLVDQLTQLTGATYRLETNGGMTVMIGGRVFVQGNQAFQIDTTTQTLTSGVLLHNLVWRSDGSSVNATEGKLGALLQLRDTVLPQQLTQVDLLATGIVTGVNALHFQGYGLDAGVGGATGTGRNFFDPMTNSTLNLTGLATNLIGGQFAVGAQQVTVNPNTDTLNTTLTNMAGAIDTTLGHVGAARTARASFDAATGLVSVDYDSTVGNVALGSAADTSNFLQLVGLRGASDVTSGAGPNFHHHITGLIPVPLVSAANVTLDPSIAASDTGVQAIAAAAADPSTSASGLGDNTNALAIAGLQRALQAILGNATFADYYSSNVAALGVQARQAQQIGDNQKLLTDTLTKQRQATSGVSLDEEATNLIRYQRAYQAAARGMTTLDDMLETIISRMGRAGL